MYYILNETDQIIAADDMFLALCGATHINALISDIIKGEIDFDLTSDDQLEIKEENFTVTRSSLSSLLGNLTLVQLSQIETNSNLEENIIEEDDLSLILNEQETTPEREGVPDEEVQNITDIEDDITFGDHLTLDDTLLQTETVKEKSEISLDADDDSALFNLVSDPKEEESEKSATEEDIEEKTSLDLVFDDNDILFGDTPPVPETSEITIDVEKLSQKIGISSEDYNSFLNEFIDTALSLEKDLQTEDKRNEAVNTLSHLSKVLHLPELSEIIASIAIAGSDTQREVIESFYGTLSRLTTHSGKNEENPEEEGISFNLEDDIAISNEPTQSIEEEEIKLELFDDIEEKVEEVITPIEKAPNAHSFGKINLDDVKAKHFDFQLEEAANDLSLPVELIEEFVHDFIEQALIETKKMLAAYEEGDLDAIQKIGHLLKGASSNLRINPLSDTLYQIQFCEDSTQLEMLIKDYWAHFLSFEHQINVISK